MSVVHRYIEEESPDAFTACFGWIKRLFRHSLYPGGPEHIIADCEWLDMQPHDPVAHPLPVGKRVIDREVGTGPPRMIFLKGCTPYNIALLPARPQHPVCLQYYVIDRTGKLGAL